MTGSIRVCDISALTFVFTLINITALARLSNTEFAEDTKLVRTTGRPAVCTRHTLTVEWLRTALTQRHGATNRDGIGRTRTLQD